MSATECPSCGFDNRLGALFCGSCGNSLGRPCPSCGVVVDPGLAYCTACGAAMEPSPAPTPSTEERKVVTVLFADLVGSTSRADGADPEDVRRLLDSFHSRLREELERFGGTVEKYIGDAAMALFGAPRAHEDDPERAVRSALALREAIGELNAADPELGIQVRVGITTGEAAINLAASPAAGESMAAGDVVNTAARLQSAAPVNGILVDDATRRATEASVEYREAEPVLAHGKKEAVHAWEVVAPRARLGIDIAFRGGAPLVGRDHELELLLGALERAERERTTQLVTLIGEPGMGKSRLVYELYAALHADPERFVGWRQGRSLPYGEGVSFWALGEMVKAQAGILESDPAATAQGKLEAMVGAALLESPDADWVVAHLRPLVGLGGGDTQGADRRTEAFAAWRRLFEALADARQLVLVFEDVHWADDGLLDFVDHLVDWASGVPLLVVCTARPELLERRATWGGGKRNALTVSLAPLSDGDTSALLSELLSRLAVENGIESELLARAGGNPLYAEEYVRMHVQAGAHGTGLPESVQGIIAARLDSLPPDEKAILQDASIVGKVFWVGALGTIGGLEPEAVEERLLTLERKEFVRRERRSSVAGESAYVFRHVLVRDVAYGQIPRSLRADKHRLAAAWIESLSADRIEDVADLVAHHYRCAVQFAEASGAETGPLAGRARRALREAGDRALSLNAFASAARLYRAALELWPEDDSERPRLLLRFGTALFHAEGTGTEVLGEAAEELLDAGDREGAAEAHVALADQLFLVHGLRDEAVEHLEAAGRLLAEEPSSSAKAAVLANRARFHMIADETEDAIRVGFEAFKLAEELGLAELQAHTLNTLGVARSMIGDAAGIADLERSIALAEELNSPEAMRSYNNLASMLANRGDLARAYELYALARSSAERFGHALALQWLDAQRMDELYWRGEWDELLERADAVISVPGEGSAQIQLVDAYLYRARIRLARGDTEAAVEDAGAAEALARTTQDPQVTFPSYAVRGAILLAAGFREEAGASASELVEAWRESSVGLPGPWIADLARVLASLDRATELVEIAKASRGRTRWLDAAVALAEGDPAGAAGVYAEIGALPEEAAARLLAAEALVRAGRAGEARDQLGLALRFLRAVGADASARDAERLLSPT